MEYCKQIKDSFWYCKYYNVNVIIDRKTGYANATKLYNNFKEEYSTWFQNNKMRKLFLTLEKPSYEIKDYYNNEISRKYSGIYIHPILLPYLISWINERNQPYNPVFIYVITTQYLESENIYKIGMTNTNIQETLNNINKSRHPKEQCFIKLLYRFNHAIFLECTIYDKLKIYRDNGEYFQCDLSIIEEAFREEKCEQISIKID